MRIVTFSPSFTVRRVPTNPAERLNAMIDVRNISTAKWEAMVSLMDDEIREKVHVQHAGCSHRRFAIEYDHLHAKKYGDSFEPFKLNGTW